jgi:hypothetical protein
LTNTRRRQKQNEIFNINIFVIIFFCVHANALKIERDILDIGIVKTSTTLTIQNKIINDTKKAIKIGLRPSCECITVMPDKWVLPPGKELVVSIKVNTAGYFGAFRKRIFVQSSDTDKPFVPIDVTGSVENDTTTITVPVSLFYYSGCFSCVDLKKNIFPKYEKKYGVEFELTEYMVDSEDNYKLLLSLEKKFNKSVNKIPVLVIGEDILEGEQVK